MNEYFHDPMTKTLFVAPLHPHVTEKKDRRGTITLTVSAYIQGFCFDKAQGPSVRDVSYPAKDFYTSRDTREQAVNYFKMNLYPRGSKITQAEFVSLYEKYQDELNAEPQRGPNRSQARGRSR